MRPGPLKPAAVVAQELLRPLVRGDIEGLSAGGAAVPGDRQPLRPHADDGRGVGPGPRNSEPAGGRHRGRHSGKTTLFQFRTLGLNKLVGSTISGLMPSIFRGILEPEGSSKGGQRRDHSVSAPSRAAAKADLLPTHRCASSSV